MKLVAQENYSGCSVAVTAYILGISYQEALGLFPPELAEEKGYFCHEIVEALYKRGVYYNWGYIKSMGETRLRELIEVEGSVVYVDNSQGLPRGHYLVRTADGWMNSWSNFREWPSEVAIVQELPGNPLYVVYPLESI